MDIVVIGSEDQIAAHKQKFALENQNWHFFNEHAAALEQVNQAGVVFDYIVQDQPNKLSFYRNKKNLTLICAAEKIQLAAFQATLPQPFQGLLIGINAMPGMLQRAVLECTLLSPHQELRLKELCELLQTNYLLVQDRVGMVTPRIVCMIINEACYTLQEGTATVSDIDTGMKLGTNYPFGPFEWANLLGIHNVYQLLDAVYSDTRDERYKICPLLKTMMLNGKQFDLSA